MNETQKIVLTFVSIVVAFTIVTFPKSHPYFKVGDCIIDKNRESWEGSHVNSKIQTVGKFKYRIYFLSIKDTMDVPFTAIDNISEKVPCPKELEKID
jgi:hypothetical protein